MRWQPIDLIMLTFVTGMSLYLCFFGGYMIWGPPAKAVAEQPVHP